MRQQHVIRLDQQMPVGWRHINSTLNNQLDPFTPVLGNNTPAKFEKALLAAKRFLEGQPRQRKILTVNAWNEWTEGSYLEPDTLHQMRYLEAIHNVFGSAPSSLG